MSDPRFEHADDGWRASIGLELIGAQRLFETSGHKTRREARDALSDVLRRELAEKEREVAGIKHSFENGYVWSIDAADIYEEYLTEAVERLRVAATIVTAAGV